VTIDLAGYYRIANVVMHSGIAENLCSTANLPAWYKTKKKTSWKNVKKSSLPREPPLEDQVIACNGTSKTGLNLIMLCSTLKDRGE